MILTDDDLKWIRGRSAAATAGPWMWRDGQLVRHDPDASPEDRYYATDAVLSTTGGVPVHGTPADRDFIAHARDDLPKLLTELDRLRRIERLAFAWHVAVMNQGMTEASAEHRCYESCDCGAAEERERRRAKREIPRLRVETEEAEAALHAELIEQWDDGHGREPAQTKEQT